MNRSILLVGEGRRRAIRLAALVITCLACLVAAPGAVAQTVIDDFSTNQALLTENAGTPVGSTAAGGGIVGGERDLELVDSAGGLAAFLEVTGGALNFRGLSTAPTATVVWDGADGDASVLAPAGLGGVDLTAAGTQDAFLLTVGSWGNAPSIDFEVFTDAGNSSTFSLPFPGAPVIVGSPQAFSIPFASFTTNLGSGADFTDVGAITLSMSFGFADDILLDDLRTNLLSPDVTATKNDALAVDVGGDGFVDPGDQVEYTVVITNSGSADATGVTFSTAVDSASTLVVGSVTTSQGAVTTGNTAGDATVEVAVGTLPSGGGTATITFEVVVDDPLDPGVTELVCQGNVTGASFSALVTDDPATQTADDPTVTAVRQPAPGVLEIPTLGEIGIVLLALLLAGAAVLRLRA